MIFIDEVQKAPALLDEVHALIEAHGTRCYLTGSSARKLRRGGANTLAGRAALRHLYPLTYSEQAQHFELERTLRYGSLPAVVTQDDEAARELLRTYADVYLREEIQAESLVRNLGGFARFLDIAAGQCGDILNVTAVARDATLAARTVQSYYEILEDTLIGFRLEAWRKGPRARLVAHPRFYLFDTGVTNALNRRLSAVPDRATLGRLFEQWVVLECRRAIEYSQSEARLFYWRTNVGAEVDLLIEKHGRLRFAAEIKFKQQIVAADCSGLRSFLDAHPRVPSAAVCLAPNEYQLGSVQVLSWRRFLERLPEWI